MHGATLDIQSPERRGTDRRRQQRLLNRHTLFGGRRRGPRRVEERIGYIADQHGLGIFLVVVAVALLNILDAFYTMFFLSHGAVEMNPFVDWVLVEGGVWPFIIVKSIGIGVCVSFLTLTKNFPAARIGLLIVLVGYLALFGWHLHLLGMVPE